MKKHQNLVLKWVALGAQGIVDAVPGVQFFMNIVNNSPPSNTLLKEIKVKNCVAPPQSWFGGGSRAHKRNPIKLYANILSFSFERGYTGPALQY